MYDGRPFLQAPWTHWLGEKSHSGPLLPSHPKGNGTNKLRKAKVTKMTKNKNPILTFEIIFKIETENTDLPKKKK